MRIESVTTQATSSLQTQKDQLTSETFLTLLAAQLQSQDPLEPMSGQEMLTQLSQLTSVGELMKLNDNLAGFAQSSGGIAQMAALLGRRVEWQDASSGEVVSGTVTRLQLGSSGWEVRVGEQMIAVGDLLAVE